MQDQQQRDAKSVHIFMGLLLGALVAVVGLVLIWIADEVIGVRDDTGEGLAHVIEGSAVVVAVVYVYRHRRR